MPVYSFICPTGHQHEMVALADDEKRGPWCEECDSPTRRDYRAEAVGFSIAPLTDRVEAAQTRDLFLPTVKDFESAEDPTGENGMKEWMETHEPRPTNKRPLWPKRSERQGV